MFSALKFLTIFSFLLPPFSSYPILIGLIPVTHEKCKAFRLSFNSIYKELNNLK